MNILILFLIIWTLSPGPIAALTLDRAKQYGQGSGLAVALGASVSTGLLLALFVGAYLWGSVFALDERAFGMVEQVGAFLIIGMGLTVGYKATHAVESTIKRAGKHSHQRVAFMQGMTIVAASIPQSFLFYAVLIPQTGNTQNLLPLIIGLGLLKVLLVFSWHAAIAIVANQAQQWFNTPHLSQRFDFITASFLVLFGVNILL